MKQIYHQGRLLLLLLVSVLTAARMHAQCGPATPSFVVNLVGSPNGTYTSPNTSRNDTCCGGIIAGECVKFVITLDPGAIGINFGFASGAQPPGALFYQIACAGSQSVGTPICLNGPGPHVLTFCKPGGNSNTFSITSIPKPTIPDSIMVRDGCSQTLTATGFSVPTINWTAVNYSNVPQANGFLSCTSGCSMVVVTPTGNPGSYIDYEVSGYAASPCQANFYRDTIRVYFYSDLQALLSPTTICFGSISANLTPTVSGGKPGYTYTWSTGSNAQNIVVGAGNYTLRVGDATGCPPTTVAVVVGQFTLPISANAGPNQGLCKSSPNAGFNATVVTASGGIWSGGTGTFTPTNTVLNTTYIPTPAEISTGSVQLFLTTTGNAGCPPGKDTVNITFQNVPVVNAGADKTVCANNNVTAITGTITGFPSTFLWSGSGSGTLSSLTSSNITYTPSAGDIATGTLNIILTSTNNGACPPAKDTLKIFITPQPTVNAGPDQLICSTFTAALSGTVSGPTNTGSWTTSGDGTFIPGPLIVNPSYVPGTNDINTGSVSLVLVSTNNGSCNIVRDTMKITIRKIAIVNAGLNQVVCSSQNSITLAGAVSGGTNAGIWSSSGTGPFAPSNAALNGSYSMTPGDATTGSVIFTLTSAPNGPCPAVSDSVMMLVKTVATVSAGTNQFVCSAQNSIALQGLVLGSTSTGSWNAGGTGTFTPANNSLVTNYFFSAADQLAGLVSFTLTSTQNGVCPARTDTVLMRIMRQATVSAGPNLVVCSSPGTIALNGSVTGSSVTGIWTTSGNGTFAQPTTLLLNSYSTTAGDALNGSVIFTLTSTNNGPCPAQSDSVLVLIKTIASVNAGLNQSICSSQGSVGLSGTITGVTNTGTWSATGAGQYIPGNSVSTSYSFTANDINVGLVTFTLTSTGNGICAARTDTVRMRIVKPAVVSAGASQSICTTATSLSLNGSITSASNTGTWSGNGTGAFIPNNAVLTPVYTITPTDILAGNVIFTLTSSNNGPCAAVTATTQTSFINFGSVSAGTAQSICASQKTVALSGVVTGASGTGSWSASGTGSFVPNNSQLNTTYSLTAADITNGAVTFTLRTTNSGPCPVQSHTISVSITKEPTVTAIADLTICSIQNSVALTGTVLGGTGGGSWTHNGAGTLSAVPNNVNGTYYLAPSDVVAGAVQFILSSANSAPCAEKQDTFRLIIKSPATVNAGVNQVLCSDNNTIQLAGSISGGGATTTWTASGSGQFPQGNTNLATIYSLSTTDIANGFVNFTIAVTNNSPCPAAFDTVLIVVRKKASVNSGADKSICATSPLVNLSGSINGVTSTGTWSTTGTGVFAPSATVVTTTYSISAADILAGNILFVLKSNNNGVCSAVADTMKLNIIRKAVIDLKEDTTICEKQNPFRIRAIVTDGTGPLQWVSSGTGTFTPNAYSPVTFYNITPSDVKTGNVVLTITSNNNNACGNVSSAIKVNILPSAKAAFSASSYSMYLPADNILFTNSSTDASTYKWTFGDGLSATQKDATHTYTAAAFYTVTLIANNEYKCSDTVSKVIAVLGDVVFPNAFTPNPNGPNGGVYSEKDYSNDVFFPFTGGVVQYDLMIFNRWGELLFRSIDLAVGWDGYFSGKLCQQDTYVWKANITFFDGRSFNKTGTVTLLR